MKKKVKLRLLFTPTVSTRPMTSLLARNFDLDFNILQARVDMGLTGRMILDVTGEAENIEKGLAFLRAEGVEVSELQRTIVWDENACVSCGACTAVCSIGALTLDEKAHLVFRQDMCVLCERCVPACPFGVLAVNEG